jgi:hypothetical protein
MYQPIAERASYGGDARTWLALGLLAAAVLFVFIISRRSPDLPARLGSLTGQTLTTLLCSENAPDLLALEGRQGSTRRGGRPAALGSNAWRQQRGLARARRVRGARGRSA